MPATVLETTRPLMTARGKRKNEPQLPAIVVAVTFQLPSKTVRAALVPGNAKSVAQASTTYAKGATAALDVMVLMMPSRLVRASNRRSPGKFPAHPPIFDVLGARECSEGSGPASPPLSDARRRRRPDGRLR